MEEVCKNIDFSAPLRALCLLVDPHDCLSFGNVKRVRCSVKDGVVYWGVSFSFLTGSVLELYFDTEGDGVVHIRSVVMPGDSSPRFELPDAPFFAESLRAAENLPIWFKRYFLPCLDEPERKYDISPEKVYKSFHRLVFTGFEGGSEYADRFCGFDAVFFYSGSDMKGMNVSCSFSDVDCRILVEHGYGSNENDSGVIVLYDCGMGHFIRSECFVMTGGRRIPSLNVAFGLSEQLDGMFSKQRRKKKSIGRPVSK